MYEEELVRIFLFCRVRELETPYCLAHPQLGRSVMIRDNMSYTLCAGSGLFVLNIMIYFILMVFPVRQVILLTCFINEEFECLIIAVLSLFFGVLF